MGVDFYPCDNCGEVYADCGDYFSCECGHSFCSNDCGQQQYNEEDDDESTCIFCRHEHITDRQLLVFLLKKYNLIEEEVTKECLEEMKNGK